MTIPIRVSIYLVPLWPLVLAQPVPICTGSANSLRLGRHDYPCNGVTVFGASDEGYLSRKTNPQSYSTSPGYHLKYLLLSLCTTTIFPSPFAFEPSGLVLCLHCVQWLTNAAMLMSCPG